MDRDETLRLFETVLFREEMPASVCFGLEPSNLVPKSGAVPLWERDGRFTGVGSHASRKGKGGERNTGSDSSGARGNIKDLVIDRLAKLLWMPVENIKPDLSLANLGVDSMLISEFRHRADQISNSVVGIIELLAQNMTVKRLAAVIEDGK